MNGLCKILVLCVVLVTAFMACKEPKENPNVETARRGRLKISADESFKAIIDSQIAVFLSEYPDIRLTVEYKPEADCLKDFEGDSTRLVIVTRPPDSATQKYYNAKFTYGVSFEKVANDAVAVILNPAATDTLFTVAELRDILLGTSTKHKLMPVFDGLKVTSNLRFMLDSVLKTDSLPANITGLESSQAVIDFVARNKSAIGFVGVSWVGDSRAADQDFFIKKVKIASLRCEKCTLEVYKKPWQYNIGMKQYPLVRGLYYMVKNDRGGVATNFGKWLELERGQLIFKRAYMVPTKMNVFVEDAMIEK